MTPGRRWGAPTDASAVMFVRRVLSHAMRSKEDNDLSVHSFMLSLHDFRGHPLRLLPAAVSCSMNFKQRIMTADMTES